jgi:hypothetical protein
MYNKKKSEVCKWKTMKRCIKAWKVIKEKSIMKLINSVNWDTQLDIIKSAFIAHFLMIIFMQKK